MTENLDSCTAMPEAMPVVKDLAMIDCTHVSLASTTPTLRLKAYL